MMPSLTAILCDASGRPLDVDGPLVGISNASVTLEQLDLFEGHVITVSGDFRRNLATIAPWTTVKIVEAGVGVVAWGVITNPEQQISDQGNRIVLNLANISEQLRLSDTGLGWIASTGIGTIVDRLGALRPGWTAAFLDSGPNIVTSAPVQWTTANATATANTLTKTGGTLAWDGYGISRQMAAGGDCAATFVVLSTATNVECGLAHEATFPTPYTIDYSLLVTGSNVYTVEHGVGTGPVATVAVGDILRVGVEAGVVNYYKNNLLIRTSTVAPVAPFFVAGLIFEPNAQLGGVTFTRLTPPAEAWYAIRFEQTPLLGALTDLAKQTFHHVRLGRRAANDPGGTYLAGDPMRTVEFGTFGAASNLRLISGTGGSVSRINTNPDVRIITAFRRNRDAGGVINSVVPLGGGTGDTQVDLERCWRIVNDPTYPGYGKYGPVAGSIFPEYDPRYPLPAILSGGIPVPARPNRAGTGMEVAATLDGRYEYRVTDPASITYWRSVFDPTGTAGETGELRGQLTDATFAYTDQTPGNQEVTARGLYVAAMTKLRYSALTNETISLTTTGAGRVSRAGDLVHVDYTRSGTDRDGVYTQVAVQGDYTVLGVKRTYDDNGPVRDDWLLSDKGFRANTDQSAAADARRAMQALQLVPTTGLALLSVSGAGDCDVTHPYDKEVPLPGELFRVRSAPLTVVFRPVRHTYSVAAEKTHQHSYTIPTLVVRVSVSGTASVNLSGSASVNVSGTASVNLSGSASVNVSGTASVTLSGSASITSISGSASITSISGSASINNWGGVAVSVASSGYAQSYGNPTVNDHSRGDHPHEGINTDSHNHPPNNTTHSHHINDVVVFIDPKAAGVIDRATVSGTSVVTDIRAGVYGNHTHGEAGAPTNFNIGTDNRVAGSNLGTNAKGGFAFNALGTYGGNASISGTATGPVSGTGSGSISGTGSGSITGTGSGSITGTGSGSITGTGSGSITGTGSGSITGTGSGSITGTGSGTASASGTGSTDAYFHTIGPDGGHTHDLTAGIVETSTPMRLQLWIDSGDGQFVDRSPQLGGPFTGSFSIPDISQFIQAPGRTVRIRLQPQSVSGRLDGLGSVQIFATWVVELGGVSSVVFAQ